MTTTISEPYPVEKIQGFLLRAMEDERMSREDIANLLRVHTSYINMIFSLKSCNNVPKYVYLMLSEWILSKQEFKEWFMEKCNFMDYEKFKRPQKKRIKVTPKKVAKKENPNPNKEAAPKTIPPPKGIKEALQKMQPESTGNQSPLEHTLNPFSGVVGFLEYLKENEINAELTITIK